jgi:UDP-N-acetylmuramoylalanine--D-glutamate ligase
MVLSADDPVVAAMAEAGRRIVWFGLRSGQQVDYGLQRTDGEEWLMRRGERLLRVQDVGIKGRHNISNALAAVALSDAAGLSVVAMTQALRQFPGLEHRMQWVAEIDGVGWINDSKATNIGACIAALQGLTERAVLIAGGDGKGADFSVLAPIAAAKVRAAILMGRDAPALDAVLRSVVPTVRVGNMKQAVEAARGLAQKGDTVLLAPACASLDQYKDYQERGRLFVEAVRSLQV